MDITKNISNLIASQFPGLYRDTGEEMVAFLEAYYEFLEQTEGYSEYMNRSMFDANDIDRTVDEFVVHFKEKYLSEFPYVTFADKRFMIKHINDFYTSKGSAKSVKLLMKMLFGEEADVYYPAKDILKPSDSKWVIPNYIELESSDRAATYVGKRIIGSKSKATANVDGLVRKRAHGKLIDVLYLSDVTKEFVHGDYITDDGDLGGAPKVDGSLRDITISDGGVSYNVGDTVNLLGANGEKATGIVTEVINPTDKVNISIIDGGYGYTLDNDTKIYISTSKLRVVGDTSALNTFDQVFQYAVTATHSLSNMADYLGQPCTIGNAISTTDGVVVAADETTVRVVFVGDAIAAGSIDRMVVGTEATQTLSSVVDDTISGFIVGVKGQGVGVYYDGDNTDLSNRFVGMDLYTSVLTNFRALDDTQYFFTYVETGSGFTFEIADVDNVTTVTYNTDFVSDYLSVSLNSSDYGFPATGTEIVSTSLAAALSYDSADVGAITRLTGFNPGAAYESDPFVVVVNPYLATSFILDNVITVDLSNVFPIRVGDKIRKLVELNYTAMVLPYIGGNPTATYSIVTNGKDRVAFIGTFGGVNKLTIFNSLTRTQIGQITMPTQMSTGTLNSAFYSKNGKIYWAKTDVVTNAVVIYSIDTANLAGGVSLIYTSVVDANAIWNTAALFSTTGTNETVYWHSRYNSYLITLTVATESFASTSSFGVNLYQSNMFLSQAGTTGGAILFRTYASTNQIIGVGTLAGLNRTISGKAVGSLGYNLQYVYGAIYDATDNSIVMKATATNGTYYYMKYDIVSDAITKYAQITSSEVILTGARGYATDGKMYTNRGVLDTVNYVYTAYPTGYWVDDTNDTLSSYTAVARFVPEEGVQYVAWSDDVKAVALIQIPPSNYSDVIGEVKDVVYPEAGVARVELRVTSYDAGYIANGDTVYFFASSTADTPKGDGIVYSVVKSYDLPPLGLNAIIEAKVQNSYGTIQSLRVNNSGFGYADGELITITPSSAESYASNALGYAVAVNGGLGAGYWETTTSHLNSDKKIRDNYYYQEYSYEIQSGLALDRFKDIVKNTVHVAGTELFGKVINKSVNEVNPEVVQSSIELI